MILETKRLFLRKFTPEDIDWQARMYADINVMKFLGKGITLTTEQTKKTLEWKISFYEKNGFGEGVIVQKDTYEPIGHCGFGYLPDKSDIELAYALTESSWGKGFATEISKAVLEYGFNNLGMKRIVAMVYPQNSPSIHVIEKTGMLFEKEIEFWGSKLLLYSKES
jgi:ribosomal-protein-alanine N-acetyltransferase